MRGIARESRVVRRLLGMMRGPLLGLRAKALKKLPV